MQEKNLRPNVSCTFPLSFFDWIISKILAFSKTLISVRRLHRKTTVVPFPLTTATQSKLIPFKRYHEKLD